MTDRPASPASDGRSGAQPAIDFRTFVLSLAHAAAVHFGDIADPVTGKAGQPNLAGAQHMIGVLAMLDEKTRGNLSTVERQALEQLLYDLRMRYVTATKGDAARATDARIVQP